MARGLCAPLSPNEELTLRRVALGIALAKDLPAGDVLRLLNLGLIEDRGEHFGLTALGRERYEHLHKTIGGTLDNAIDGEQGRPHSLRIFDRGARK